MSVDRVASDDLLPTGPPDGRVVVEEVDLADDDTAPDPRRPGRSAGSAGMTGTTTAAAAHGTRPWRRAALPAGVVALVLLAAWSGHSAGVAQGRAEGERTAVAANPVVVRLDPVDGVADAVDGRVVLTVVTVTGRPTTLRGLRIGPDTVTPVQPLPVPNQGSTAAFATARSGCGSARELELMRAGPGADHVGDLFADVTDPDGTRRRAPVVLLPDDATFRAVLRLAACG